MTIPVMKPVYGYPSPVPQISRNGIISQDLDASQELESQSAGVHDHTEVESIDEVTTKGNENVVVEEIISTEQSK